ncbi:MAG: CoA transferase, partial [Chloroflexota bacterium]
ENLAGVRGVGKRFRKPGGEMSPGANHIARKAYRCKDGWLSWAFGSSRNSPGRPLIEWMDSEGMADDFLRNFDWDRPDFPKTTQDEMDRMEKQAARFFLSHTKAELLDGAVKHGVMLYPVSTTADMLENPQLIARQFWVEVEHPELGVNITYPGPFGCASETPLGISRRAPLIGEHNREIYEKELGISKARLTILKKAGVI